MCLLVALLLLVPLCLARHGVDMSQGICADTDQSDFTCLKRHGYDFAIIQVWQGGYEINTSIKKCTDYAWKAGLAHVDVYAFMCPECRGNNPPKSAIDKIADYLHEHKVKFGMLWIDVEQCDGCWYGDAHSNCEFVVAAAHAAESRGLKVGIYSSDYEWSATVGSCSSLTRHPLWYAHYDGEANFDDSWAYHFGGWTKPSMKQYADTGSHFKLVTILGSCFSVDSDWYPDSMADFFQNATQQW